MTDGRNKPSPRRKLTAEQVREMRFFRKHGWGCQALAERYGVAPTTAWLICETDHVYKDVPRG